VNPRALRGERDPRYQ